MKLLRHKHALVPLLALATSLFSLLVFAAVGALELQRERARLLLGAKASAEAAITLSAAPVARALWNYDTEGMQEIGITLLREGEIVAVEVLADDATRPIRVTRAGWSGAGSTSQRSIDLHIPARPGRIGVLRITESMDEINHRVVDQALSRLPLELLKVAATAVGLLLLVHRMVTRRLQAMVSGLAGLRNDDPQARLPLPDGAASSRDEIVVLASAINRYHAAQAVEVQRRRQAEGHLREQLQERSVILGSLRDALFTLDGNLCVHFANASAAQMLGCALDDLVGQPLTGRATVHDVRDDPAEPIDLAAWLAAAARQPGVSTGTVRVQPAAAAAFDARALVNPLAGGGDVTVIAVVYDVSEILRREQAELARERAEAASLAKSQFLSHMSHELRTPLNAIVGFAQALGRDPVVESDAHRLGQVQLIERAGWHLTRMIGDVLELSRIEAGSLKLELRTLDVTPLLDDAAAYLEDQARGDDVRIAIEIADDARHVRADALRLEQVLVNLISNAVKYNRPGGQVQITASVEGDDAVAVSVQDTGLGISEEQIGQLYQSFNRLGHETSSKPGTGIGLVITRALVEMMHGRLSLQSSVGVGSCFTVHLPRAQAPLAVGPVAARDTGPAAGYGARRVVYVEDDPVNAQVMLALLGRRPTVQLQVCATLAEGWDAIVSEPPHLVLLDMQLPDGSGLDLVRRLKADPVLAALPVLMVSADVMNDSVSAALAAGARAYVTKPFDFGEVLKQVDALLAGTPAQPLRRP